MAYPSGPSARKRRERTNWVGIAARKHRLRPRRLGLERAESVAKVRQLLGDGGVEGQQLLVERADLIHEALDSGGLAPLG
eukprot:3588434-Alexandrium_andersonii.AAC.1